VISEESPLSSDFLAILHRNSEPAAMKAGAAGIRVVNLRIPAVLGGYGREDVNSELLKKKIDELNQKLRNRRQSKKETLPSRQALKKLEEDCLVRLEKYEQQEKTLAGHSSYSKTDPDASCMRMKEDRGAERRLPAQPDQGGRA
jgi:hypothetical protein